MRSIRMTDEQVAAFYEAHPCPSCAALRAEVDKLQGANAILRARVAQLEGAVEWACMNSPLPYGEAVNFANELRRRAGEG